jgi:Arc/MetJ-type ribon-helix-helix transcriptional regulator
MLAAVTRHELWVTTGTDERDVRTISIRVDEALLEALDAAAKPARRRRSEIIREALELWLRRRATAEQVRRHREGYRRHPANADEFEPVLRAQRWPR